MRLNKYLKDDSGFTLIEVMLAVAILALVALPIINYFTYSSVRTIEGRDKQTATTAAEDVIEELSSYSHYDQIKKLTATPDPAGPAPSSAPVWRDSSPGPGESPDPQSDYIERTVTIDGFDYLAKVQIQYGVYNSSTKTIKTGEKVGSGTGDVTDPKYNDYDIPNPSEVYAPSNVVAEEDDEKDTALSDIYTTLSASGSTVDWTTIGDNMKRTICVDIDYKDSSKKQYAIHVYYKYEYAGKSVQVTLEKSEIEVNKFKSVFVFYDPLKTDYKDLHSQAEAEIHVNSDIPQTESERVADETIVNDMEFYFAVQGTVPNNYKLHVSAGRAENAKYFVNDIILTGLPGSDGMTKNPFIIREQTERIGRILVDVYETAGKKAGQVVAHMETTLAE